MSVNHMFGKVKMSLTAHNLTVDCNATPIILMNPNSH